MKPFVTTVLALIAMGIIHCGSDSKSCSGITCTNCSGSGDCNITCSGGQTQHCIAHPDNSNLRCAYCQ